MEKILTHLRTGFLRLSPSISSHLTVMVLFLLCLLPIIALIPLLSLPLTSDEFQFTTIFSRFPTFPKFLKFLRWWESHPPTSFIIIWLWGKLTYGIPVAPEIKYRILSLSLLAAASGVSFLWLRQHASRLSAAFGLIVILNAPVLFEIGIEIRNYQLLVFWFSLYLFFTARLCGETKRPRRDALLSILFLILATLTHLSAAIGAIGYELYLLGQIQKLDPAHPVARHWRHCRRWVLLASLVAGVIVVHYKWDYLPIYYLGEYHRYIDEGVLDYLGRVVINLQTTFFKSDRVALWYFILGFGAISSLRRKNWENLELCLFPFLLMILLSAFRLYPLGGRYSTCLLPFLALLVARSLDSFSPRWKIALGATLTVFVTASMLPLNMLAKALIVLLFAAFLWGEKRISLCMGIAYASLLFYFTPWTAPSHWTTLREIKEIREVAEKNMPREIIVNDNPFLTEDGYRATYWSSYLLKNANWQEYAVKGFTNGIGISGDFLAKHSLTRENPADRLEEIETEKEEAKELNLQKQPIIMILDKRRTLYSDKYEPYLVKQTENYYVLVI